MSGSRPSRRDIAAFNAYRNLQRNQARLTSSPEQLSSGLHINRAADDPSGLVRSERLRSQIGGMRAATRNAQDAISLAETVEGAQAEAHFILQRMRDLTVQSDNIGTNDRAALAANQSDLTQLQQELDRVHRGTQLGTRALTSFTQPSHEPFDPVVGTVLQGSPW